MKILFTAFKGVHNTSFQLVDQTAANYILLTNSFQGLEKDISFISSDYSIVYMFGVDKKLILVSGLHMELASTIDEALEKAFALKGRNAKVVVIPDGLGVVVEG